MKTKKLRILLLSWEILPIYAGGLGFLSRSVVDELKKQNCEVTVLLPFIPKGVEILEAISLSKKVQKFYKQKKPIPGLDFALDFFKKSNKPVGLSWPRLFGEKELKNRKQYNLYPNNTPAITRSFAHSVLEFLKEDGIFDVIIGMDWETIATFQLLKVNEVKTPFIFYINGTEFDRNLDNTKLDSTTKEIWNLEKRFYNQANFLVSVSDLTKNILVKKFDVPEEKVLTVFNDVDFLASNKTLRHLKTKKNILFVGRVSTQKGLFFLIDTMSKVVKIDAEVQLILAGDGELMDEVVEFVCQNEISKNVLFTGWVSEVDKKRLYNSSDLFVMPSPSEPFGLTPLEAIKSGLPVISSENCGFLGVVPSTPVFKYYDTENFSRLILYYLNNSKKRQELILKQQEELSVHSWSKQIGGLISKIKSVKKSL